MLILLNHMSFVSMASEQYVDIPDAKLKYSICYQLGKPSYSNLTKEDMGH